MIPISEHFHSHPTQAESGTKEGHSYGYWWSSSQQSFSCSLLQSNWISYHFNLINWALRPGVCCWPVPQLYSVQLYSANGAKIRSCDSLGISFGTAWYFQPVWSLTSLDRWGGEVVRAGLAQEQGLVLVLALLWELASVSSYMEYIASQEMHSWECWSLLSPHSWALVLFPAPPQC